MSAVPPLPMITEPNTDVTEPLESYSGNVIATTVGVWRFVYDEITTAS